VELEQVNAYNCFSQGAGDGVNHSEGFAMVDLNAITVPCHKSQLVCIKKQ